MRSPPAGAVSGASIRELRQHASRYLRDVEGAETIEVTDRGRPVALLTPVPVASAVERLRRQGRPRPAAGHPLDLGAPLEPRPGVRCRAPISTRSARMSAEGAVYLDASALVQLVVRERETGALDGAVLRSLDAIHLAGARSLDRDLAEIVTYDVPMAGAARALGLPVAAPA